MSPRPLGPAPEPEDRGEPAEGMAPPASVDPEYVRQYAAEKLAGEDCGTASAGRQRDVMSVEQVRRLQADRLRCLDEVQQITAGRDFDVRDLVVLAHYVHTGEEMPYLPSPHEISYLPPRESWELG